MIHACLMACYDGPGSAYWVREPDDTERLTCKECNGYRPFASAIITPVVEIEIRAAILAEIADSGHAWWDDRENDSESYGLLCAANGGTPGDDDDGGSSAHAAAEWSGYLAHIIANTPRHQVDSAPVRGLKTTIETEIPEERVEELVKRIDDVVKQHGGSTEVLPEDEEAST